MSKNSLNKNTGIIIQDLFKEYIDANNYYAFEALKVLVASEKLKEAMEYIKSNMTEPTVTDGKANFNIQIERIQELRAEVSQSQYIKNLAPGERKKHISALKDVVDQISYATFFSVATVSLPGNEKLHLGVNVSQLGEATRYPHLNFKKSSGKKVVIEITGRTSKTELKDYIERMWEHKKDTPPVHDTNSEMLSDVLARVFPEQAKPTSKKMYKNFWRDYLMFRVYKDFQKTLPRGKQHDPYIKTWSHMKETYPNEKGIDPGTIRTIVSDMSKYTKQVQS